MYLLLISSPRGGTPPFNSLPLKANALSVLVLGWRTSLQFPSLDGRACPEPACPESIEGSRELGKGERMIKALRSFDTACGVPIQQPQGKLRMLGATSPYYALRFGKPSGSA